MRESIPRREAMSLLGAAGAALAFGCQSNAPTSPTETTATAGGSTNAECAVTPNPASNARDGIFADGLSAELATVSGDPASGLTANFQVAL